MVSLLSGPTALAFSYDDPVAPAKIISEFARTNKALEVKGGVLEGKILDDEAVSFSTITFQRGITRTSCPEVCKPRFMVWLMFYREQSEALFTH